MIRVAVLSPEGKPLMPAKASRVRRWLGSGKAKVVHNDLGIFQVQLIEEPSGEEMQEIATGIVRVSYSPGLQFNQHVET